MSAPRLTTLAIKGLVTTPNEYGVYPEGSCSQIENLLARSLNQWSAARDTQLVYSYPISTRVYYKLIGVGPGAFVGFVANTAGAAWRVFLNGDFAQEFVLNGPLTNSLFDHRYLTPFVARNRLYANGKQGVAVFDAPTVSASRVRAAGLPQPTYSGYQTWTGPLPNAVTFTYAALVRRRTADGYVITSPPSVPVRYSYGGSPRFTFRWGDIEDYQEGDVFELYRSAGISGGADVTDTGTSMRLVTSHEVNATDRASFFVDIFDRQPAESPLYETEGLEIYTSPYQDGSTGANLQPPSCKAAAQWGAYTFFGNVTDDPIWTLDVPAGLIDDPWDAAALDPWVRANAVGVRAVTGTRSSGSPTITGVSAADIVGIKPGQIFGGPGFTGGGITVVSVGASTVTVSANASSSGTSAYQTDDWIELNGQRFVFSGYLELINSAGGAFAYGLAFYPSETVPIARIHHTWGTTISIRPKRSGVIQTLTVRGTNAANYSPVIPEYNQTAKTISQTEKPNVLRWSRMNQPEAVPSPNEAFVGSGSIIKLIPATDCLWILCTDGAYRLSGSAGVWRIDLIDRSFVPVGPDACCELNDIVYAITPRGLASLSGTQVTLISRGVIDAEIYPQTFSADNRLHLWANPSTEELVIVREASSFGQPAIIYVYSTLYQQWSTYHPTADQITAGGMLVPSNADLAPYLLFASYVSNQAHIRSWRGDAGSLLSPSLTFQPFYAGDPLVLKRWIDTTWLIAANVNVGVTQRVHNNTYSGFSYFTSTPAGDGRASIGIPRSAAIAPSIILRGEFGHLSSTPMVLKGLSIRHLQLTTQQRSR